MKEGWEYKKIKDVAQVIGGSTPKTNVSEYWGGDHYWVTPAELDGSKYISETSRTITDKAVEKTNLTLLPKGTVLLSSRAPIGKVCITQMPMFCNQGFKNLICGKQLYNEFAYYFLINNVDYLQSLGTGATFKEISKKTVENVNIPIPPLSEQQQIVDELDLLSSIIEKKKEQLKELDNLSQSIFYGMFGDPVANEKGWEVKPLKEICKRLFAGGDVPKNSFSKVQTNDYSTPIFSNGLENDGLYGYTAKAREEEKCITIAGRGVNVGTPILRKIPFFPIIRLNVIVPDNSHILAEFLLYFFKYKKIEGNGGAIPQLTIPMVSIQRIFLPPLSLQQQFASKIEAIEHQKELIKQSIKETETLFNSRMDYYFN